MRDLTTILAKFVEIVSYDFCNDTAKKTRFIQRRTSRLKGHEFAQAMMVPNAFLEAETLNSLATRMQKTNATCCVSASALCQKINTRGAEHFMKLCFGKVLKEIVGAFYASSNDLLNLRRFNRVLVEDSTKIELNEKLSFYFQGTGGVASKSAVKIDYIFDYLSEETVDVEFYSGNIPDQALACRIMPILKKDDLVLRDLGYYALNALKEIEEKEAFYISRFQTGVSVYTSEECEKPVDLARFLDQLACNGIVDVKVFIGSKKHPVRLVACQISEEALNKRHRDANRAAQRRGTAISKKKKSLLKYCIFITNVSEEILSSIAVMSTYRARWRIELIFKQWKSCLNLHVFKGYNRSVRAWGLLSAKLWTRSALLPAR